MRDYNKCPNDTFNIKSKCYIFIFTTIENREKLHIGLCLFNKTDIYSEAPVTGYQYNVAYKITDSKIAFEIKNGAVIRNH